MSGPRNRQASPLGRLVTAFSLTYLLAGLAYLQVVGTGVWAAALNRWGVVFPTFLCLYALLALASAVALKHWETPGGKLGASLLALALGGLWVMYYVTPEKTWCIDFPAWNQVVAVTGLVAGGLGLLLNFGFLPSSRGSKTAKTRPQAHSKNKKTRALFLGSLCLGGFLLAGFATHWFRPYYEVHVPPEDERPPVEFSFWGHLDPAYYAPAEWEQLDRHSAIIVAFDRVTNHSAWAANETLQHELRVQTYQWARWVRDNYPNVRLMWPTFGGYYHMDHYEADVYGYLEAIRSYNLTNTIGFIFDLERAWDNCSHDATLLHAARESLQRCFAAIRGNDTGQGYRIANTGGIWVLFDELPLGGSFELYKQHPLMSQQATWTGYQWQLYRGNAVDPASDPASTDIYERIWASVQFLGANATIPLFGMTGVGDYGPNNCSVDASPGTRVPCNMAGVTRDCRIARALGVREVSFFTLSDAGVHQGVYYPSFFEAYGPTALDDLDAAVNRLASPVTFHVPGRNAFRSTAGYWWENVAYSLSGGVVLVLAVIATSVAGAIHFRARGNNGKTASLPPGKEDEPRGGAPSAS